MCKTAWEMGALPGPGLTDILLGKASHTVFIQVKFKQKDLGRFSFKHFIKG